MPAWVVVIWIVVVAAGVLLGWRGHVAREDQTTGPREPLTPAERVGRARDAVGVVWLLVALLIFVGPMIGLGRVIGVGSFLGSCLWRPDLGIGPGAAFCGTEQPSLPVIPFSIGVVLSALILAASYVLGGPYSRLWLLGLFAWTVALIVGGAMAPPTLLCTDGRGGSTITCFYGWRPGWEWLAIFVLGPLLIVLASRFVRPRDSRAYTPATA
jgi:hypothetical protein